MSLPRKLSAAANMAFDLALLEDNRNGEIRFRHYAWASPAASFGYTQSLAKVREVTDNWGVELMRRPTGGGIVDHRQDWTYALVIPENHRAAKERPLEIYLKIHEALQRSLTACAIESAVARTAPCDPATACFSGPVRYDLTDQKGNKIAGAAMKRTRHGILIQGSVWHPTEEPPIELVDLLKKEIRDFLDSRVCDFTEAAPSLSDQSYQHLETQFSSDEWKKRRI